jgi:hypothetical protein
MNNVYVIQNQHSQFLSRQKEWLEKTEIQALFKTPHRDLAVNEWVELTAREPEARARVVSVETSSKGLPLVSALPPLDFPKAALPDDLAQLHHPEPAVTGAGPDEENAGAAPAALEKAAASTDICNTTSSDTQRV